MTLTLARRERHDLCDLALELDEGAATLCGDWTAGQLLAHLWIREHRPLSMVGGFVSPLSFLTDAAMARAGRTPYRELVSKVREPGSTVFALRPVEKAVNTLEYVVHHEDLRRGQPAWEPRGRSPDDLDETWLALGRQGRLLARGAGVPVTVRRDDTGAETTLRGGGEPVEVSGPVLEVLLTVFGRSETRGVEVSGPPARVRQWQDADHSF